MFIVRVMSPQFFFWTQPTYAILITSQSSGVEPLTKSAEASSKITESCYCDPYNYGVFRMWDPQNHPQLLNVQRGGQKLRFVFHDHPSSSCTCNLVFMASSAALLHPACPFSAHQDGGACRKEIDGFSLQDPLGFSEHRGKSSVVNACGRAVFWGIPLVWTISSSGYT